MLLISLQKDKSPISEGSHCSAMPSVHSCSLGRDRIVPVSLVSLLTTTTKEKKTYGSCQSLHIWLLYHSHCPPPPPPPLTSVTVILAGPLITDPEPATGAAVSSIMSQTSGDAWKHKGREKRNHAVTSCPLSLATVCHLHSGTLENRVAGFGEQTKSHNAAAPVLAEILKNPS